MAWGFTMLLTGGARAHREGGEKPFCHRHPGLAPSHFFGSWLLCTGVDVANVGRGATLIFHNYCLTALHGSAAFDASRYHAALLCVSV